MAGGPLLPDPFPPNPNPNSHPDDSFTLPTPLLDPLFFESQNPISSPSNLFFPIEDNYEFDISLDDLNFDDLLDPLALPPYIDTFTPTPNHSGSSGASPGQASGIDTYLNSSPSQPESGCVYSQSLVSSHGLGNLGPRAQSLDSDYTKNGPGAQSADPIKIEGDYTKNSVSKRKKETTGEVGNHKYHSSENVNANLGFEEEDKQKTRLMRNRESAQLSRQRKKHYVEELEQKVRVLHSTIADLNGRISYFMAENASLRQQLSVNGVVSGPMYPPVGPTWVPYPGYMVRSQGSRVPLVPIPRLKTKETASGLKEKKVESKRTKKVASVSLLGLLLFVMLFGCLVPLVNVRFGGGKENGSYGSGFGSHEFYDQHRGRVLVVSGHSNGSREDMGVGFSNERFDIRSRDSKGWTPPSLDGFSHVDNGSEPLFASLYVPRNDKLVKIDGNLIIHSILASEKAVTSRDSSAANRNEETGLAIPKDVRSMLAIPNVSNRARYPHLYRALDQQTLTSGSDNGLKDHFKSSAADGKMQQWFREGLVGPMLSSGMCTEVFQFDISPAGGAIVPASSVTNIMTEQQQNATKPNKGRNRRTLHGLPDSFQGPKPNVTGEPVFRNSENSNFQDSKHISSTVVSVLVDPRDASEIEVDGMIGTKSLSRIFVVVLLDSIKYVTYSCMLPRAGLHLVTT